MKTIKIIDLLNKIANGEEVPKNIKWGEHYFEWFVYEYKAIKELGEPLFSQLGGFGKHFLTDEVEILDEEDEFEDITVWGKPALEELKTKDIKLRDLQSYIYLIALSQNNLIKNQKKIIERLSNEKGN